MSSLQSFLYISLAASRIPRYHALMTPKHDAAAMTEKPSGWRGSRDVWIDAARQALIEAGVEAVKIQPLAARLQLARTSFYWFFKDRRALLDALLEAWADKNTGAIVTACDSYAESITEAILNLIVVFHDENLFEPQLDFAIRSWAHGSETVAGQVHEADDVRLNAIRAMFERFGFEVDALQKASVALERFSEDPGRYRVAILDLTLAGSDGLALARDLRRIRGDIPVLIASGFARESVGAGLASLGRAHFLQKPYTADALMTAVESVVGATD